MVCPCIPPPPPFDIPPPPDPSLIWHLISDNREPIEQIHKIQQCSADLIKAADLIDWVLSRSFLDYLPYIVIAVSIVLSLLLIIILIFLKSKRLKTKPDVRKRSFECAGDIVINGKHHLAYDQMDPNSKKGVIIYSTSIQNNDFFSKAVPYSTDPLCVLPKKSGTFGKSVEEKQLPQSSTTLLLHSRPDGYYAACRTYEEIPPRGTPSKFNSEDSDSVQLNQVDRNLILRDSGRKPPPTCRPPPPPSQGSPYSTGSSINSIEHELQHIHSSPSPKRSIDDDRKSRHSGDNGRESGYGTAPSRLWCSPRLMPRVREIKNRSSNDASPRQVSLAVFAQQNNAHSTMTYV